jgi:hypothetical protein
MDGGFTCPRCCKRPKLSYNSEAAFWSDVASKRPLIPHICFSGFRLVWSLIRGNARTKIKRRFENRFKMLYHSFVNSSTVNGEYNTKEMKE